MTTSLSCATMGASIYYTLNGVTPDPNSPVTKLYSGEQIQIGSNLTIKAIGYRKGWIASPIYIAQYSITTPTIVATPSIYPGSGSYTGGQVLSLHCNTPQSTIWYTTNGQEPMIGKSSTFRYQGPVTLIAPNLTIRAIAVRDGWSQSAVAVSYISISAATELQACTFSPQPGAYGSAQMVSILNSDPSAQIYYTTDGTDPYIYMPLARPYSGPVAISSSRTLKAQAFRPGFGDSPRTTGVYTISAGRQSVEGPDSTHNRNRSDFSVVPNPFSHTLSIIRNPDSKFAGKICIMDASGRTLTDITPEEGRLNIVVNSVDWPDGLYFIRIPDDSGKVQSFRVIKD